MLIFGLGSFWVVARTPMLRLLGLTWSHGTLDAAGAAAGVLATNVVIAAYVLSAWEEEQEALVMPMRDNPALPNNGGTPSQIVQTTKEMTRRRARQN